MFLSVIILIACFCSCVSLSGDPSLVWEDKILEISVVKDKEEEREMKKHEERKKKESDEIWKEGGSISRDHWINSQCPKIEPPSQCFREMGGIRGETKLIFSESSPIALKLDAHGGDGNVREVEECLLKNLPARSKMHTPVVYVNQDKDVSRRERMERILPMLFHHVHRSPAPVWQDWLQNFDTSAIPQGYGREFGFEAWGPTSGHYQALIKARDLLRVEQVVNPNNVHTEVPYKRVIDSDAVLIFEDDVSFGLLPLWQQNIDDFLETLPDDWHLVQLGSLPRVRARNFFKVESPGFNYIQGTLGWGAFGYAISRKGLDLILDPARGPNYLATHCRTPTADDCLLGFGAMREPITTDKKTFARHYGGDGTRDLFSVSYTASPPFVMMDVDGPSATRGAQPAIHGISNCKAFHAAVQTNPNGNGWLRTIFEKDDSN